MSSVFNPDTFMNTSTTDALSTTYTPVPEGEWTAVIKEIKPRVAKEAIILDILWAVDEPEVIQATGMKVPIVRQSIFLDMTESGGLDIGKGKNIGLGKLREALGQNQKGQAWAPGNMLGGVAKIRVAHRMYEDTVQADVKGVTAL
jgi:hypothetical protein